jgi:hypothetical protein
MSDHPTLDPDDRLDELASAYLDGVATAHEAAEVERDPRLLARVESLRRAAEAVATDVPSPPDTDRDQAIARAVAAFEPESAARPPVDLAAERTRRRSRRGLWVASAAAALLALVAGVSLLRQDDGSTLAGRADSDAAQPEAGQPSTTLGPGAGAGDDAPAVEESADAPLVDLAGAELGEFSDVEALVAAVRTAGADAGADRAPGPTFVASCESQLGAVEEAVGVYSAALEGEPVNAVVYIGPSDRQRLVVVTPDCEVVIDTEL